MCYARAPLVTLCFLHLFVSMYVSLGFPTYHMCNNYITYIVAMRPYFSWLREFRRLLCIVQRCHELEFEMDTEKQRQRRCDNTRLKRQKWAATRDAYRVTNQQKMVAKRALEWIRTSKARLVFRYEISNLWRWWRSLGRGTDNSGSAYRLENGSWSCTKMVVQVRIDIMIPNPFPK